MSKLTGIQQGSLNTVVLTVEYAALANTATSQEASHVGEKTLVIPPFTKERMSRLINYTAR